MSKELFARIREQAGEDILPKIDSDLRTIEGNIKELQLKVDDRDDTIRTVNSEAKQKKLKIRELESDKSDLEDEVASLKDNDDAEELATLRKDKKEREEKEATEQTTKAKGFVDTFEKQIKDHADFKGTEGGFVLPKPDDDGNYNWDDVEEDDMVANVDKFEELQGYNMFGDPKKKKDEERAGANKKDGDDKETNIYKDQFEDE